MITEKQRALAAMRFLNHLVQMTKTAPDFASPLGFMLAYLERVDAPQTVTVTESDAQACLDKLVEKGLVEHVGPAGWSAKTNLQFSAVGPDADPWSSWVTL
jgi:hypothetical protein